MGPYVPPWSTHTVSTDWNFTRGLRAWLALRKTHTWTSMSMWVRDSIEIMLETLVKTVSRHIAGIFFPQMWLTQELNQTSCFLLSGALRAEWKLFQRNSQRQNFTLGTVSLSRLQLLKSKMKLSIFRDCSIPPLPAFPKSPAPPNTKWGAWCNAALKGPAGYPFSFHTAVATYDTSAKVVRYTFSSVI